MVPARIPLVALAAFALGAAVPLPAQQPAAAAAQPAATAQAPAPASAAPATRGNATPAPQGNLIIQVMDDDGTPVPGADIEVDGMRTGAVPSGVQGSSVQPGSAQVSGEQSGDVQPGSAQPDGAETGDTPAGEAQVNCTVASSVQPGSSPSGSAQPGGAPPKRAAPGSEQAVGDQPQPGGQQLNTVEPGTVESVGRHPRITQSRRAETVSANPGSSSSGSAAPGAARTSGQASDAQPQPNSDDANTVQPGTAQAINCQAGAAPSQPALPPGEVPLRTDAQGELVLQLPDGPHSISVSIYGFDPFTGSFALSGKHRQIVQIKLSTAPTSYVLAVGPDGRIQPVGANLDSVIPLEPVETLGPLPARARHRVL